MSKLEDLVGISPADLKTSEELRDYVTNLRKRYQNAVTIAAVRQKTKPAATNSGQAALQALLQQKAQEGISSADALRDLFTED